MDHGAGGLRAARVGATEHSRAGVGRRRADVAGCDRGAEGRGWLPAIMRVDWRTPLVSLTLPLVVSRDALLANLFLHYTFDVWMRRSFPGCPFERYADDAVVHCRSKAEAQAVVEAIRGRFAQCHLELHPTKTRIVYCQDDDRPEKHEIVKFDFLGYTFQPRRAKNRWGKFFVSFLPAMSTKAAKAVRKKIREWRMASTRSNQRLEDLAQCRQSGGPGLDELLRSVLPVQVRPSPSSSERGPCCMGAAEIHAVPQTRTSLRALARPGRATGADPLRALATRRAARGWGVGAG